MPELNFFVCVFVCVRKCDHVCNICNNFECKMFNIYNKKCVCECVCAPARDPFNRFLIPAEKTLNTYSLIIITG